MAVIRNLELMKLDWRFPLAIQLALLQIRYGRSDRKLPTRWFDLTHRTPFIGEETLRSWRLSLRGEMQLRDL